MSRPSSKNLPHLLGRFVRRGLPLALVSLSSLLGCAQILGADFDAKTTSPEYFAGASNRDSGGRNGSGGSSGGETASGGTASGGSDSGGSGGMESGGSGGSTSGGAGSGGTESGGTGGVTVTNLCAEPADCSADDVLINELSAQGRPDFIELYNAGDLPADLGGYAVTDGSMAPDLSHLAFIPDGTVLEPGKFLYLQEDEQGLVLCVLGEDRCLWFDFGISKSGETVYLMNPDNEVQDSLTYPGEGGEFDDSVTYGRYPDGGDDLGPLLPTEKLPNVQL